MPVSSFTMRTEAPVMKLPAVSVMPPLMVALVDWESTHGGTRQRTSRRRQENSFIRRCSELRDERCSSCLRLDVEICISCFFDFMGGLVGSEGMPVEAACRLALG